MQQETKTPDLVLYSPTEKRAVDFVRGDRCVYAGVSRDELNRRYGGTLELLTEAEVQQRIEQAYSRPPREVDRDRWENALDVLPPMSWVRGAEYESFYISEPITETVHTVLVRIGARYFEFAQPRTTRHSKLVQMVLDVINGAPAAHAA